MRGFALRRIEREIKEVDDAAGRAALRRPASMERRERRPSNTNSGGAVGVGVTWWVSTWAEASRWPLGRVSRSGAAWPLVGAVC